MPLRGRLELCTTAVPVRVLEGEPVCYSSLSPTSFLRMPMRCCVSVNATAMNASPASMQPRTTYNSRWSILGRLQLGARRSCHQVIRTVALALCPHELCPFPSSPVPGSTVLLLCATMPNGREACQQRPAPTLYFLPHTSKLVIHSDDSQHPGLSTSVRTQEGGALGRARANFILPQHGRAKQHTSGFFLDAH